MKPKLFKLIAIFSLLLVSILLSKEYVSQHASDPSFRIETSIYKMQNDNENLFFESQIIPQPSYLPAAHSSSFTVLPNGDLLAFWFAGTKEGRPDVKIWTSTYHAGVWSMATPLVDPQMISNANHRYVVKVGNPVIYQAVDGNLHLFVVSVSIGGWSGSTLNHLISEDKGKTWSKPERIVISPFLNISTLVRTSAVTLNDGSFYLPVYHEFIRKYPELLHFDASGKFIEQIRITSKNYMLQPSIMPINSNEAFAYFRNSATKNTNHTLYYSKTNDGGKTWDTPQATNLTNHDASIASINLHDGRYLMVYNQVSREHLWLAVSHDGINWTPIYHLEDVASDEFSYPDIHATGDNIDIMYTNNRKNIKHVRFNREWLDKVIANAR